MGCAFIPVNPLEEGKTGRGLSTICPPCTQCALKAGCHTLFPALFERGCKKKRERVHDLAMRILTYFSFSALVYLLLLSAPACAVESNIDSMPGFLVSAPTNVSKELRLQGDLSYIEDSDFSNGLGSVNVARLSLSADYSIFNLSYGYSRFNWHRKGLVRFVKEQERVPWENLHDVTLRVRALNNKIADNWRYWLNGRMSSSFERDFPGAIGAGLDGGIAYDFWDGWMVGVTLRSVALSPLSDDLFGEQDYGVAIAVSQRALRNAMRSVGLVDLDDGSDSIGFSFAFTSSDRTYRLAPDSPVESNGYLSIIYSKIGAYLDYSPNDQWTFSLGPEFYYDRKYRFHDSKGKSGSSYHLDNGWGGYARVLWHF
jgi:hypothetical protein